MNIGGNGLNAIFGNKVQSDAQQNLIRDIPLSKIKPNPQNPYRVEDETESTMQELVESIRTNGVQTPAIVRPNGTGDYELISGHRRCKASGLAGKSTLPCIVRKMEDDEAIVALVDANQQRVITPMERARAIRLKLDALQRLGKAERVEFLTAQTKTAESDAEEHKTENGADDVGSLYANDDDTDDTPVFSARDNVAESMGISPAQVHRYNRLNNLTPELQDRVDKGEIAVNAGAELSYLTKDEQNTVNRHIEETGTAPSITQAKELRSKSKTEDVDEAVVNQTMNTNYPEIQRTKKKDAETSITIFVAEIADYFYPKGDFTPNEMKLKILQLVKRWSESDDE